MAVTQSSAVLGQRLHARPKLRFRATPGVRRVIRIGARPLQRYIGVGGAMTDSSAELIEEQLPPGARRRLFDRLFSSGRHGIGLRFVRVPIGASDFTATGIPYTYDDLPSGRNDPRLRHFTIAHDRAYVLPALRAAVARDRRLYVEAVPWSAPAWMKANDRLDNLGDSGALRRRDYGPFARYLARFLRAYARAGIHIAALSPANEPVARTSYPGMYLPAPRAARFLRHDLQPALRRAHLHPALFGWDLSWGRLPSSNPLVRATRAGSLRGIAWHCYFGGPRDMTALHAVSPRALQIVDECATGSGDPWTTSELEIASFRNWAGAVAEWNLALDPNGGPVQPPNRGCAGCTGIVTVDPASHRFTLSPDYDELGQVSRFVRPGARRLHSTHFVSYRDTHGRVPSVTAGLDDVVFRNPGGGIVLIAYDNSRRPIRFAIAWRGRYARYTIPPHATATLRWR
ncbi:MAG TPA: glycoside hydrolase family 30 beta sandwich domain-containing protein [Solirubrobacteraceae bacterium]|nr:glycoside hydrolase family 30 beta sandwich domain-containing protein [Solirubrobacteraceae bacterium]